MFNVEEEEEEDLKYATAKMEKRVDVKGEKETFALMI